MKFFIFFPPIFKKKFFGKKTFWKTLNTSTNDTISAEICESTCIPESSEMVTELSSSIDVLTFFHSYGFYSFIHSFIREAKLSGKEKKITFYSKKKNS